MKNQKTKDYLAQEEQRVRSHVIDNQDLFVIYCEPMLFSVHGENRCGGYLVIAYRGLVVLPSLKGAEMFTKEEVDKIMTNRSKFLGDHKVLRVSFSPA